MAEGNQQSDIGMVGLGVMGRNLLLNMADHGFAVAGYDKDPAAVQALRAEAEHRPVHAADSLGEMIRALKKPRAVMMLVPAGGAVDAVLHDLLPYLEKGDLVIDGGNSFYQDTELRTKALVEKDMYFMGVGISGGEHGARHGPSIMPGGSRDAYERVRPIFEAVAAKVNGNPCVTYLGEGSAGHYVKMVHNGIEYGLMQLIAETYDLMKRGLHLDDDALHAVYARWDTADLNSFLIEITAGIFLQADERTGKRLIDVILDTAHQKGTGMWTSQDAMDLGVPVPTIDVAVAMRNLSAMKQQRVHAHEWLDGASKELAVDKQAFVERLHNALYMAMVITYAQGMAQLQAASEAHRYGLNLSDAARIWRGGCIIRAAMLEDIRAAYSERPDLPNLAVDDTFVRALTSRQDDLREVVRAATSAGIPVPCFMASLGYFDAYRSQWLPANLIQAQRDYFGAHTYERVDSKGTFHTQWEPA